MRFYINIATGNAAMEEPEHIAQALREVAEKLDQGKIEGPIIDANGNTVGTFVYEGG